MPAVALSRVGARVVESVPAAWTWPPMRGSACQHGRTEVVRWFLDLGVSPDVAPYFGRTGLHWAIPYGHLEVIRLLPGSSARVNSLGQSLTSVLASFIPICQQSSNPIPLDVLFFCQSDACVLFSAM